ncbi:MAG: mechanosensitive ion channel family protein [Bacillota bacterium]
MILDIVTKLESAIGDPWGGYIVKAVELILIVLVGRIAEKLFARAVGAVIAFRVKGASPERVKRLRTASTLITSIAKYVIYFLVLAAGLGTLGLSNAMNSMLASVGIGGLALGIGAQSLINDVVTGFFLLFEDQLSVGDYIEAGGVEGVVESIALRTTSIRGFRGELIVVPNGKIATMTNYSRGDYVVYVDTEISLEADAERAIKALSEEAEAFSKDNPLFTGPVKVLGIAEMKDLRVTIRTMATTKALRQWEVVRALNAAFKRRLEQENIGSPYPKVTLVHSDGGA